MLGLLVIYRGAAAHTAPGDSRQDPSCAGGSALPSASFSPLTGGQRSGQARRAPVLVAVGTGRTSPPLAAAEAQRSLRYSETAPRGQSSGGRAITAGDKVLLEGLAQGAQ